MNKQTKEKKEMLILMEERLLREWKFSLLDDNRQEEFIRAIAAFRRACYEDAAKVAEALAKSKVSTERYGEVVIHDAPAQIIARAIRARGKK